MAVSFVWVALVALLGLFGAEDALAGGRGQDYDCKPIKVCKKSWHGHKVKKVCHWKVLDEKCKKESTTCQACECKKKGHWGHAYTCKCNPINEGGTCKAAEEPPEGSCLKYVCKGGDCVGEPDVKLCTGGGECKDATCNDDGHCEYKPNKDNCKDGGDCGTAKCTDKGTCKYKPNPTACHPKDKCEVCECKGTGGKYGHPLNPYNCKCKPVECNKKCHKCSLEDGECKAHYKGWGCHPGEGGSGEGGRGEGGRGEGGEGDGGGPKY